jgi:hypothetical protein
MLTDLRAQHEAYLRDTYDGHNRKPQKLSMRHIHERHIRRRWRGFMRQRLAWLNPVQPD